MWRQEFVGFLLHADNITGLRLCNFWSSIKLAAYIWIWLKKTTVVLFFLSTDLFFVSQAYFTLAKTTLVKRKNGHVVVVGKAHHCKRRHRSTAIHRVYKYNQKCPTVAVHGLLICILLNVTYAISVRWHHHTQLILLSGSERRPALQKKKIALTLDFPITPAFLTVWHRKPICYSPRTTKSFFYYSHVFLCSLFI